MAKDQVAAAGGKPARALPKFIVLQAERGEWKAGRVLHADADLIAALEIEGVKFIEATDEQRRLGGFVD